MVLKCADIGHLAASPNTHKRWAYQLEEEFFRQVIHATACMGYLHEGPYMHMAWHCKPCSVWQDTGSHVFKKPCSTCHDAGRNWGCVRSATAASPAWAHNSNPLHPNFQQYLHGRVQHCVRS